MKLNDEEYSSKTSSISTWKKLKPFINPHKKLIFLIAVSMMLAGIVDVIIPLLSGYAVTNFIEAKTLENIVPFSIVSILLIVLSSACTVFMAKFAISLELNVSKDIRNAVFKHIQTLSFDFFNATPVGTILARVLSDTGKIGSTLAWSLVDVAWATCSILGYIIVMCFMNIKLAVIVIAVVPCVTLVTIFFQGKILSSNRKVRTINSELTRTYNEGISGAKTTKTMGLEDKNLNNFKGISYSMRDSSVRAVRIRAIYHPIIVALTSLSVAFIITSGGSMVIGNTLDIGEFAIFVNYALIIAEPVAQLSRTITNFIATQVNVERCNHILEIKPQVKDSDEVVEKYGDSLNPKKENWEELQGHITFDNIDFRYPDGKENVLENFSLDVPIGTTVAIVGETGAGKSTLVNLACRFFEPTKGKILIDGKDYKERSLLWLHSNIGYVLQTPHLFSGTIKDNIRYGRLDASDEDIINAAKIVSAHDSIISMKDGYDTQVGEGGDQLSTGQKQLISFARAIIANPKIFVLDEATASIDTHTESLIQNAISNLLGTKTTFIIAHRLSTVRTADIILVVKNGKIIEQGTHKDLLQNNGYYANLYNKQFEDEMTTKILENI